MTMNPDWLLKHFEQISEAPDAVPRLRRFILDLAVRGKLVEQDPEDEPASELLKRIEAEKGHWLKDRRQIRKQNPPIQMNEEHRLSDSRTLEMGQLRRRLTRYGQYGKHFQCMHDSVSDQGSDCGNYGVHGMRCRLLRKRTHCSRPAIIIGRKRCCPGRSICVKVRLGPLMFSCTFDVPPAIFNIRFLDLSPSNALDLVEDSDRAVKRWPKSF